MARADRLPTYAVPLAALVVAFIIYSVAGDRHPNVKDVSVSEARELIAAGAVVIDVRDRSVSGSSHINGALLIPLEGLADRMSEVSVDKSAPIVVYCNEGTNRGPRGTALLNEAGYTQAVNLKTGIEGWRAANLPTAAIK
jgi:rhodanese-related sulfurtransferase